MPFKIDMHSHILPREWPHLEGVELRLRHMPDGSSNMEWADGTFFRKVQKNCFDAGAIIEDCDSWGVDVQVMCTVPVMFNYHLKPEVAKQWCEHLNDDLSRTVRKNPRRLVGLGTLPMQDPKLAVVELRRCVTELGLRGVQLASHINSWQPGTDRIKNVMLSDESLQPIFEAAAELGAAIFVHPWDMEWCDKKYWLPWLVGMPAEVSLSVCSVMLSGLLEKFPSLKIMFAHGGGAFPGTLARVQWGYKCRPDLVAVDSRETGGPENQLRKIYVDSVCHDPDILLHLLKLFGADRIALGSDYPFPLGEVPSVAPTTAEVLDVYPGRMIEEMALEGMLSQETTDQLLSGTALEFLGLKDGDFDRHDPTKRREEYIAKQGGLKTHHKEHTNSPAVDVNDTGNGAAAKRKRKD